MINGNIYANDARITRGSLPKIGSGATLNKSMTLPHRMSRRVKVPPPNCAPPVEYGSPQAR